MGDPVRLMDGRMASSKAKLVIREKRREVDITSEPFQQEFLKNLRRNGKEANRSIGGDVIDGFARFRYHYDLCKFTQEWVIGEAKHAIIENSEQGYSFLG
jgi:hypothetical protein